MVRTMVQLTDEQIADLRRLADRRGTSMAAVVREAVDQLMRREGEETQERRRRALAAAGMGDSGLGDLSVRHDDYLAEDFAGAE